jgi:hypothetical protein
MVKNTVTIEYDIHETMEIDWRQCVQTGLRFKCWHDGTKVYFRLHPDTRSIHCFIRLNDIKFRNAILNEQDVIIDIMVPNPPDNANITDMKKWARKRDKLIGNDRVFIPALPIDVEKTKIVLTHYITVN